MNSGSILVFCAPRPAQARIRERRAPRRGRRRQTAQEDPPVLRTNQGAECAPASQPAGQPQRSPRAECHGRKRNIERRVYAWLVSLALVDAGEMLGLWCSNAAPARASGTTQTAAGGDRPHALVCPCHSHSETLATHREGYRQLADTTASESRKKLPPCQKQCSERFQGDGEGGGRDGGEVKRTRHILLFLEVEKALDHDALSLGAARAMHGLRQIAHSLRQRTYACTQSARLNKTHTHEFP